MGKVGLCYPDYTQTTPSVTPSLSGGSYESDLPLSNVADRDLSLPARSSDTELSSTRLHVDLGTSRAVGAVVIPKHSLSKTGAYVRVLAPDDDLLFSYEAGDDITVKGGTFANATANRTYLDRNGIVRYAAAGVIRDAHFESSVRTSLLELSRTNLCIQSQTFDSASWSKTRTTVSANADTAPDGTATADRVIEDATAASTHFVTSTTMTITANATVAYSVYAKAGSPLRTWARLKIGDATDGFGAYFNLGTGATGTTVNNGAGVLATKRITAIGSSGWYRLTVTGAVNNGKTTIAVDLFLAEGDGDNTFDGNGTGYISFWGAQVEDSATFATSYIATTTVAVTRAVDATYFNLPTGLTTPVASTFYLKFVERGGVEGTGLKYLVNIGDSGSANNALQIRNDGSGFYRAVLTDGAGSTTSGSSMATAPAFGDTVELRVTITSAGVVQIHQSINGAAEVSATAGAAGGLPATWGSGSAKLFVGCTSTAGANGSAFAHKSLRIMAGSSNTLATMQASLHDSGWLDGWPSGLDAEEADGINVPFVYQPSSAVTARYWSIQLDDYANADGYVDLYRLLIAKKYEPTINMNVGARLGLTTDTVRTVSDGGAAIFNTKPVRRTLRFTLDHITEAESFSDPWLIQRLAGTSGQLFVIYNTDDSNALMAERAFLGTLEELSALEAPYTDRHAMAFQIIEEL